MVTVIGTYSAWRAFAVDVEAENAEVVETVADRDANCRYRPVCVAVLYCIQSLPENGVPMVFDWSGQ